MKLIQKHNNKNNQQQGKHRAQLYDTASDFCKVYSEANENVVIDCFGQVTWTRSRQSTVFDVAEYYFNHARPTNMYNKL